VRCVYCLQYLKQCGLASWRVAFGSSLAGSEETPPTCRIATPFGCKARALATEQKRHVQLAL